jgi:hypothetical protein
MTLSNEASAQWRAQVGITIAWLGADNIMRVTYIDKAEETLADAQTMMAEILRRIPEGKKYPILVDLSTTKSVTAEARAYHAGSETGRIASAVALMVTSPIAKTIGNFYLAMNKPLFPVRLFTNEEDGLVWLRTFL